MTERDPRWRGIHRHGAGWRAVVSQGRGRTPITRQFPIETLLREMQDWRADAAAKHRLSRKRQATRGTFEADAKRYLTLVARMPTIQDRRREIACWLKVFGQRRRDTITSGEIRAERDRLVHTARSAKDARPLHAGTINRRLRALSNLFAVLDGRRSDNPVREVEELREPEARAKAIGSYETIATILAALPNLGRGGKGETRPTISATKLRLTCLAYCQITPKQLSQIAPADLDLDGARIHLPARAKGRGASAVWVPLLPQAVAAFRAFDAHQLYGPFSRHSLTKVWNRTVTRLKLPRVTPYQLRHTYGTAIYRATRSRQAVQMLMQHASWETSERYAIDAEADVLTSIGREATDAIAKAIGPGKL